MSPSRLGPQRKLEMGLDSYRDFIPGHHAQSNQCSSQTSQRVEPTSPLSVAFIAHSVFEKLPLADPKVFGKMVLEHSSAELTNASPDSLHVCPCFTPPLH